VKLSRLFALAAALAVAASCSGTPAPPTTPTPEQQATADQLLTGPDWYRHAVFYEVYVRSFEDSNGDGIGDLAGLTSKLDYLKGLGVDAIWLMPIMPTAFKDSGYDISDYRNINPDYGDLAAFDALLAAAHQRKMRVLLDLVLNHTSDQHAWFQDSRSSKTSAHADWYVWSDTPSSPDIGCGTYSPTFGDSAWTFEPARNQYYFHRFYPQQPDLNYRNPAVVAETLDTAKFWLTRGVDGFRCDVIGLLFESATGCNMIPETVDYIKQLRAVVDQFPDRVMVAETDIGLGATPYFGSGTDMFHMAFNFSYGYFWSLAFLGQNSQIPFNALNNVVTTYPPGAQDASLIGSHDVARAWTHAQQLAWRQRRAVEISMFTKATPFVYYGDELGLHDGTTFVVDSRDSARTPMPWVPAGGHDFSTGTPWIPFSDSADQTNVQTEDADPSSMLTFYRQLLTFRRGHAVWGTGDMLMIPLDNPALLAFVRRNADEAYLVVESLSEDPQDATGQAGAALPAVGPVAWGDGQASIDGTTVHVHLPGEGSAVFRLGP
jgi:glycosidase